MYISYTGNSQKKKKKKRSPPKKTTLLIKKNKINCEPHFSALKSTTTNTMTTLNFQMLMENSSSLEDLLPFPVKEKFEETKRITRSRKSKKKKRQCNGY